MSDGTLLFSRVAAMYREKVQTLAQKACQQYGTDVVSMLWSVNVHLIIITSLVTFWITFV